MTTMAKMKMATSKPASTNLWLKFDNRITRTIARRMATTWLLVFLFGTLAASVQAHPFHISIAEFEFNPKTAKFEASIKVQVSDIERAISILAKRTVNIENDPDADKLLTDYAREHFFVTSVENLQNDKDGQPRLKPDSQHSKLHFVGKEIESTWMWLYLELEYPATTEPRSTDGLKTEASPELTTARKESLNNLLLVNSILVDVTDAQINTVSVRVGDKKHSFKTNLKQPWTRLPKLFNVQ